MNNSDISLLLFSEVFIIEQKLRNQIRSVLPKNIEMSHFSVLNHLVAQKSECTPAQLAKSLKVTKGAMTNTLTRLEKNGYINVRKDWDDARKKHISITRSGELTRNITLETVAPIFDEISSDFSTEEYKHLAGLLRRLRLSFDR